MQLSDELIEALDEVAARERRSRSDVIRRAIEMVYPREVDAAIDRSIIEGYTRFPPGDDDWGSFAPDDDVLPLDREQPDAAW